VRGSGNLKDESGDILVEGRDGSYLVECKHWSIHTAKPSEVRKAWLGICEKAKAEGHEPVLQLRINRRPNKYRLLMPWQTDPQRWAEVSESTFLKILKGKVAWEH